jgi:hypothetical protein
MFEDMTQEMEGGRRYKKGSVKKASPAKRAKSPKPAPRKVPGKSSSGKKGGIDLTPFLTSLLLLSSKMAYDKRSPSKAFSGIFSSKRSKSRKPRRRPRKVVGGYEEEDFVVEDFAEQAKKNQNQSQMADLAENVTSSVTGSVSGFLNNIVPKVGGRAQQFYEEEQQEGGKKKHGRRGKSPAKKAKSPAKKPKSPAKRPAKPYLGLF